MLDITTTFSRIAGRNRFERYLPLSSIILEVIVLLGFVNIRSQFSGFDRGVEVGSRIATSSLSISSNGPTSYVLLSEWYSTLGIVLAIAIFISVIQARMHEFTAGFLTGCLKLILLTFVFHQLLTIIGLHDPTQNESYNAAYNELIREMLPVSQISLTLLGILICMQVAGLIMLMVSRFSIDQHQHEGV